MATLAKHTSGVYYIVYYVHGKRIWRTLKTRDKKVAQNKFLEYEKCIPPISVAPKYEQVNNLPESNKETLQQAIQEYLGYVKVNCTTNTQRDYNSILKLLSKHLGADIPVADITIRDIERYKNEKYSGTMSPHTINHDLRCIKAFFNRLISWGLLENNPCKGVKLIRIDETIRPYLSKDDLQCVLKHTTGIQLHDIILFAVLTGLRLGEIVNLTWEDILLEKRKIIVRSNGTFRTKSGKMRVIPISSALLNLLESMPDKTQLLFKDKKGVAWRAQFISKQFKRAIRACRLNEKLHFHSLRHTFGSYLVESGVSLFHVQQLMGHSSPYVTQIYAHLGTAELLSSVEKIDVGDHSSPNSYT